MREIYIDLHRKRVYRPDDVQMTINHRHNCLCILNEDGSVRVVELRCIDAYLIP